MSNSVQIVKDTALNKTQVQEVYNGSHKVYNNQSTPNVIDVNIEGATGTHGLATEATLDSFRTENATNLGTLDSSIDNINAKLTKGSGVITAGGTLQQVLLYGKKADTTLQPLECSGDRLLVDVVELAASGPITTSTALSSVQVCGYDSGTAQFKTLKVDSAGVLETSGGGGGGAGSTTYNNLAFTILKPTGASPRQTNSAGIDLTNCSTIGGGGIYLTYQTSLGGDTADISDIVVQYSDDNSAWWSDATPSGGGSFVPTSDLDGTLTGFSTFFLEVMSFKARYIRLCALHTDQFGIDMATTAHLQLRPF